MHRRLFLISAAGLMTGCRAEPLMTGQLDPVFDPGRLRNRLQAVADRAAPAVLGVGVLDGQTGQLLGFNSDRPFPLQDLSRLAIVAAALAEVDAGKLALDEPVIVRDIDLSPPPSPIAEAWPGRTAYTIAGLVDRVLSTADNTAADLLMRRIGGPGAVTAWLELKNINAFRVDRFARQIEPEINAMASFRSDWKGEATFERQRLAVSPLERRAALQAYLTDSRDTVTPLAAVRFLDALRAGQLLSPASTGKLLGLMALHRPGGDRLAGALPAGSTLTHETGNVRPDPGMAAVTSDIGIITLLDGRQFVVATFLGASRATDQVRNALITEVGRTILSEGRA